jgi:hypothetical protein
VSAPETDVARIASEIEVLANLHGWQDVSVEAGSLVSGPAADVVLVKAQEVLHQVFLRSGSSGIAVRRS